MRKRVFTAAVALVLCILTVFSVPLASALSRVDSGYLTPGHYSSSNGGGHGGTPGISYRADAYIAGYRFTCWRSTDADRTQHNSPGYKLGHSIVILCHQQRSDYANGYEQEGPKAPRLYTNKEGTDYLDKISVAQLEAADDREKGGAKRQRATDTALATTHYQGDTNGRNIRGGSTFTFRKSLYSLVEIGTDARFQSKYNSPLDNASNDRPVTIYSGYQMKDEYGVNAINQEGNLYCYIYGFKYNNAYGDGYADNALAGESMAAPGFMTISDIDHSGTYTNSDGAHFREMPFNCYVPNVIGYQECWTTQNASLIATLCGLDVQYGQECNRDTEFGLHDYIIVEPLYMYYYFNQRFFCSATDSAMMLSESSADAGKEDCWNYISGDSSVQFYGLASAFPGTYGVVAFAQNSYFGVDAVLDASYGSAAAGNTYNAFLSYTSSNSGKDGTYSGSYRVEFESAFGGRRDYASYQPNGTWALVSTSAKSGPHFYGKYSWWYGQGNPSQAFTAPRVTAESMIGAGVWMNGEGMPAEDEYNIIYHGNYYNNGRDIYRQNGIRVSETAAYGYSWTLAEYDNLPFLKKEAEFPLVFWESCNFFYFFFACDKFHL